MLFKFQRKYISLILSMFMAVNLIIAGIPVHAAAYDGNTFPTQVTVAVTQDPSTSVAVNWTTVDMTLTAGNVVQVMDKSLASDFDASKATEFNADTEVADVSKSTINVNGTVITQKAFSHASVTGLTPNTQYLYRAGNKTADTWSSIGSFKTAPSGNSGFTFTYMADPQISNTTNSKAAMATFESVYNDYPDSAFSYIAGDFTDTGNNEGQWESFFNGGGIFPNGGQDLFTSHITVGTEGNHETSSDSTASTFGRHFGFPSTSGLRNVYSFDYGLAHFMVLNTNYNQNNSDLQNEINWLKQDANASNKKWKIVMLHKPLYSGAEHVADPDMTIFRQKLAPVFNELKIDAVLGGHDHVFSRGFVDINGNNAGPQVVSGDPKSDNATVIEPDAPLYMVNNTAGGLKWYNKVNYTPAAGDPVASDYSFLDRDSSAGFTQADTIREQTYTAVSVANDELTFKTYMFKYDTTTDTITDPKHIYDTFTVKKQDAVITPSDKTFDLVEITDLHGQLLDSTGKLYVGAALSKAVKGIKNSNPDRTLILGGGDLYQGTPLSNILHGVPVKDVFTDMGMKLTALGNHEFDWGLDTTVNETMKGAGYQILCANLYKKGTNERVFDPYKVVTVDGVRIAVIGAITNETPSIILPAFADNYDFKDAATEINSAAKSVRDSNEADAVVAVVHEGSTALNRIVAQLHGVNAVFGGHSHTILDAVLKDADGKDVPTLNANCSGKGYVDLKMTVRTSDGTISFSAAGSNYKALSVTSDTPLDANAKAIIDEANTAIGPTFNEVIGNTASALTSDQALQPFGESQLGNWMSDVIKNYVNADIGMQNNGGIRLSPVPAGDITVGMIFSLMPFDNTITTVNVTGAQLKTLLEQAVQDGGKGIQVSGIKFTYDPAKTSYKAAVVDSATGQVTAPEVPGQRITKIVRERDNTAINDSDVLKVAAPDFLATGGDLFTEFKDSAIKASYVDSHYLLRDALIADVRAKGTIPAVMNNRIVKAADSGSAAEMTIARARTAASGNVTVTGTVSTVCGKNIFIQDDTAGICLYNPAGGVINKGDKVKVAGALSSYYGLLEIIPGTADDVQIISSGNTVSPRIVTINQIDGSMEGQLIRLQGVTINNIDTSGISMLQDVTGTIGIYKAPELSGITAGDKVDVAAAVSQYDSTYELRVGNAEDVAVHASPNISVGSVSANPGNDVPVKVIMNNMGKVAGIKVKLSYDPVKLSVKNVSFNDQLKTNAINTTVPGEVFFDALNADGITASSMDIATITFMVNSGITAEILPISIISAEACDDNSNNITLTASNGSISVAAAVPTASNVTFAGETVVGKVLTAQYDYYDGSGRPEAGTAYRWLAADQSTGDYTAIPGATGKMFTITEDYIGKYIKVEITPKNSQCSGEAATGDNGRNKVISLGDVNNDGNVSLQDALQTLQFVVKKIDLGSKAQAAADVNNADGVEVGDVIIILKMIINLPVN